MAGPCNGEGEFCIYRWSGSPVAEPEPLRHIDLSDLHPEGIVIYPGNRASFQILSDDGGVECQGRRCKKLAAQDPDKYFRSMWVELEPTQ